MRGNGQNMGGVDGDSGYMGSLVAIMNHLIEHYQLDQLWAQVVAVDYRWVHP
jgi:hypothetical protein